MSKLAIVTTTLFAVSPDRPDNGWRSENLAPDRLVAITRCLHSPRRIPTKRSPRSATTSSGISAASKARSRRPTFVPLAIEPDYWKLANEANLVGSNGNIMMENDLG